MTPTTIEGKNIALEVVGCEIDQKVANRVPGILYHGDKVHCRACVGRQHPSGGVAIVDTIFPNSVEMNIDMCGVDEGFAALLEGLVKALRPKVVLETGTHRGRSTKAIADALAYNRQGHCWTVDMQDYGTLPKALGNNIDYVTQVVAKCPDALYQPPLKDLENIDFAFLDGDHTGAGLSSELRFVEEHKAHFCYVVVDNAADMGFPDLRKVLNEYNKYPRITLWTMCGTEIIFMHNGL